MFDSFQTGMRLVAMRHVTGRQMFCGCGAVLDCRRAVEVEVRADDKLLFDRVFCGACADTNFRDREEALADITERLRGLDILGTVTLELIDGRTFSDDDWRNADMMGGM